MNTDCRAVDRILEAVFFNRVPRLRDSHGIAGQCLRSSALVLSLKRSPSVVGLRRPAPSQCPRDLLHRQGHQPRLELAFVRQRSESLPGGEPDLME